MPEKNRPRAKSKIHGKILQFFAENQGSIDTPRGISAWVNENLRSVQSALEDLVRSGHLKAHRTSSTVGYSCSADPKSLARLTAKPKRKR